MGTKNYRNAPCPIINQKGRNVGYLWNFYGRFTVSKTVDFGSDKGALWYLAVKSTSESGGVYGIRVNVESDATSIGGSFYGGRFNVDVNADKSATNIYGIAAEIHLNSGITVTKAKAISAFVSVGSLTTGVTNRYGITVCVQTSGNETITTDDVLLRVENEAVGGAGKMMDSAIQIVSTNVTGDAFAQLIDASTAKLEVHTTDQVRLMKFRNSAGTIVTMSYDTSVGALAFA